MDTKAEIYPKVNTEEKGPRLTPRCLCYSVFAVSIALDIPAAIGFIVIGGLYRETCEVISPILLLLGGAFGLTMYVMLLVELAVHHKNGKRGYGQICANVFGMLKFGCYIGACVTMWFFWVKPCHPSVYYAAAIIAPIYCLVAIIMFVIISKL